MSAFSPEKFVNPAVLRHVSFANLLLLLRRTAADYLAGEDAAGALRVDLAAEEDDFDFDRLGFVLGHPEDGYPDELADALYHIASLCDSEGVHLLDDEVGDRLDRAVLGDNPTYADQALHAWLYHRDAVERVMGKQFLLRPKSFITYLGPDLEGPSPVRLDDAWRREIETYLGAWFAKKVDSDFVRVLPYVKTDAIWFLVRHAQKAQRRGVIKEGKPTSTVERPDKYDIVVYTAERDELALHADTKGQRELYAQAFGLFLFRAPRKFTDKGKYTLEPLWKDGEASLSTAGVPDLQSVVLRQIQVGWGGAYHDIETRSSDDVFASVKARGASMPSRGVFSATFDLTFTGKKPRKLTIRTPNTAKYQREGDKDAVDDWMVLRKFIKPKA